MVLVNNFTPTIKQEGKWEQESISFRDKRGSIGGESREQLRLARKKEFEGGPGGFGIPTPSPSPPTPTHSHSSSFVSSSRSHFNPLLNRFGTLLLLESDIWHIMISQIFSQGWWKLAIPSGLFVFQANAQYVASGNLSVPLFQLAYQLKVRFFSSLSLS